MEDTRKHWKYRETIKLSQFFQSLVSFPESCHVQPHVIWCLLSRLILYHGHSSIKFSPSPWSYSVIFKNLFTLVLSSVHSGEMLMFSPTMTERVRENWYERCSVYSILCTYMALRGSDICILYFARSLSCPLSGKSGPGYLAYLV